jgi:predicted nucleic acid-binding protein
LGSSTEISPPNGLPSILCWITIVPQSLDGHRLPLTDLAIATIALRYGCSILTTDPHFDLIVGVKRFPLA